MKFDMYCPVENQGVTVKTNSKTGEPYALFKLFNLSNSIVSAVTFSVHVFDENGVELGQIPVSLDELSAEPKSYFAENQAVSLADYPEAKHLTVAFSEVKFSDGESYIKEDELDEIFIEELGYEDRVVLMSAAGEDAQNYYQEKDSHWICLCGRPNIHEMDTCIRCGRSKELLKEKFANQESLEREVLAMEKERMAQEAEEKALAAEKKEKRNQAVKKGLTFGGIGVAALAVLAVVIYFVYGFIMLQMGNSAAKNGNYAKAYAYYSAARNNEKLGDVAEKALGNTNANLLQTGILTDDAENIYYIDMQTCTLHKQSKTTGEKAKYIESVGAYLNAVDGWIYYLDISTGQSVCRVSVDGSEKEVLYEASGDSYLAGLTVVGNDMYFIAQEVMEGLTPEMQEQLQQQGQSQYVYRLYRVKVGSKKAVKVSDQDLVQYTIYRDKIYYTNQSDGCVYYIDRLGKNDPIKVLDGSVYSFDIQGDSLYYLDSTMIEETGMPKMSLERADMNGNHQETVISDQTVLSFAFDGEDIYYLAYVDGIGVINKRSGGVDTVISENSQMFNLKNGYLMHINGEQKMMKSTFDKAGFEEVTMTEAMAELSPEKSLKELPKETPAQ